MSNVIFHGDLGKLFTALHAAQKEIAGFSKDSVNPHFKSDYASIESIIKAVKPALINNGLVIMQSIGPVINGNASLTTTIAHTSGAYMQSTGEISKGRAKGPQDDGSANAYLRRYALVSLLLLKETKETDDDGNAAQNGKEEEGQPKEEKNWDTVRAAGRNGLFDSECKKIDINPELGAWMVNKMSGKWPDELEVPRLNKAVDWLKSLDKEELGRWHADFLDSGGE